MFFEGAVLRVTRIGEEFFNRGPEHPSNRGARGVPLHDSNQVRVGRRLKLVFADFLGAIDEASTVGAIDEGLGIRGTEPEVGDDVGFTDPDGESPKPC